VFRGRSIGHLSIDSCQLSFAALPETREPATAEAVVGSGFIVQVWPTKSTLINALESHQRRSVDRSRLSVQSCTPEGSSGALGSRVSRRKLNNPPTAVGGIRGPGQSCCQWPRDFAIMLPKSSTSVLNPDSPKKILKTPRLEQPRSLFLPGRW
jgi:hypothetical protein